MSHYHLRSFTYGQDNKRSVVLGEFIAKGNFGNVYKGTETYGTDAKRSVAVKVLKKLPDTLTELYDELQMAKENSEKAFKFSITLQAIIVNSANPDATKIFTRAKDDVHFVNIDSFRTEQYPAMTKMIPITIIQIYEFIDGESLESYIDKNSFEKETFFRFSNNLLLGLEEIDERNWLHKDIKPANIMVAQKMLKYIDFGLLCKMPSPGKGTCTSINYITSRTIKPPEFILEKAANVITSKKWHKIDIFAVGVTIGEMMYMKQTQKDIPQFIKTFNPQQYLLEKINKDYSDNGGKHVKGDTYRMYIRKLAKYFNMKPYDYIQQIYDRYLFVKAFPYMNESIRLHMLPFLRKLLAANPDNRPTPTEAIDMLNQVHTNHPQHLFPLNYFLRQKVLI